MRSNIISVVEQAAKVLVPFWPLQSFIAVNPLQNFTALNFVDAIEAINHYRVVRGFLPVQAYHQLYHEQHIREDDLLSAITQHFIADEQQTSTANASTIDAVKQALLSSSTEAFQHAYPRPVNQTWARRIDQHQSTNLTEQVHDHLLRWLSAYFDQGQSTWTMPHRDLGLFAAWKILTLPEWPRQSREWLVNLPDQSEAVLSHLLTEMAVPEPEWADFLCAHLVELIGWASYIRWAELRSDANSEEAVTASLLDYLAMRLCVEWLVVQGNSKTQPLPPTPPADLAKLSDSLDKPHKVTSSHSLCVSSLQQLSIWQLALERVYQQQLLAQLNFSHHHSPQSQSAAQAVFCIDVRSEGLRRHLEQQGSYQTYGFAGFFGFAFRLQETDGAASCLQCPALLQPEVVVKINQHHQTTTTDVLQSICKRLKGHLLAPFVLFEAIGAWFMLKLLSRTFLTRLSKGFVNRPAGKGINDTKAEILFEKNASNPAGYSLDQLTDITESVCRTLGLTEQFSRLVLLCAHHSESENNPYESSLDCGACGGHSGIPNARVAAAAFNHPGVRKQLSVRGITIPADCYFVAGCHNTTTDEVELLELEHVPATHRQAIIQLQTDLKQAGLALSRERMSRLAGDNNPYRRRANWAELVPELGLINNAAFIIGPRGLTQGCQLDQRVFLHCYDAQQDHEGKLLQNILLGPLMVAHWINMQYYFSTVEPDVFGSGNKALHNVVANIGVMAGNQSDLKLGLPQQSLFYRDRCLHEPLRLFVLINAPRALVNTVLERCGGVQQLIDNQWIHLEVVGE